MYTCILYIYNTYKYYLYIYISLSFIMLAFCLSLASVFYKLIEYAIYPPDLLNLICVNTCPLIIVTPLRTY